MMEQPAQLSGDPEMFEIERATYEASKPSLLPFEGQYVVIDGARVIGVWPSVGEAYHHGSLELGGRPFYMRQIKREEPALYQPFIGAISRA